MHDAPGLLFALLPLLNVEHAQVQLDLYATLLELTAGSRYIVRYIVRGSERLVMFLFHSNVDTIVQDDLNRYDRKIVTSPLTL